MVPNTRVIGKKINNMDKASKLGQMEQGMMDLTYLERNMELVNSLGPMVVPILATLKKTIFKEMENILGRR